MPKFNGYRLVYFLHHRFKTGLCLVCLFFVFRAGAQSADDLRLVRETSFYQPATYYQRAGNSDSTLVMQHKNMIAAYNPLALVMKGSMYLYQHVITQQLSRSCPYEITCSNFSKHAIHRFGLVKGALVSADRIMRCNRISLLDVSPLDLDEHTGTISDDLNKYR
jgi:putative component of membrane protein insertase Oxa1/YidC/SpoIIIJ protein YidD